MPCFTSKGMMLVKKFYFDTIQTIFPGEITCIHMKNEVIKVIVI